MMDLNYKYAFHHQPFLKRKALETYFRFSLPRAIRRATQIIADSENTREDILKYFGLPFDKVKVIHLGLEETFKPIRDHNLLQRIRNKYKLNRKYLLYIGNTRRNKNIDGLLRGFHYLINHFQVDPQLTLVVAGYKQYRSRELREKVQKLGFINRFMQLGTIDEQDLSAVYSAAEIFLMPSFYEGFGLPALEAMACGTPVVVSNTSSLPEVVGDAGIFINPHSPEDIANGIYKLLMDETLRSNLIEKGMKRVEKFSWNEAAQKLLTIYQEVACRK
jgi:glycosyltransferase involved in cell wall biosynthesis